MRKENKMSRNKIGWIKENFWNVLAIVIVWEVFKLIIALLIIAVQQAYSG